MRIAIEALEKRYGETVVLDRVDLVVHDGEFLGLLGPSGSGKTTLLRILAGLDVPSAGQVLFDGEDVLARPVQERRVGFVFQHYALFRHMNVFENIAFGLRVRRRGRRLKDADIRRRVEELLDLVQLDGYGERFPAQLSGGQRQRVALARALAIEPQVLLLDEPFGALDAKVRVELRRWLRDLHDRTGISTVFVTHDQEEALDLADRVAVMNKGRIEQNGTPTEIYEAPATPFVYEFLGSANRFECHVEGGTAVIGDKRVPVDGPDGPAIAYVRPHDVLVWPKGRAPASDDVTMNTPGRIRFISALGAKVAVEVSHRGKLIEAEMPRDQMEPGALRVGSECAIQLRLPRLYRSDGERLTIA